MPGCSGFCRPFRALGPGPGGDEADAGVWRAHQKCQGAAAVLLLFLFSIVPLARLFVLYLIYRGVAAVLQPVADKRLVVCLSGAAQAQKMLLTVTASCFLLFAVTIALICQGTNAAYLAS